MRHCLPSVVENGLHPRVWQVRHTIPRKFPEKKNNSATPYMLSPALHAIKLQANIKNEVHTKHNKAFCQTGQNYFFFF